MPDRTDTTLAVRVRLDYPGFTLDAELDIALDRVTGLFGPSGGGKSSLLRVIAGFERKAAGSVRFAGQSWQDSGRGHFLPAHRRPVGYVFQDARLFPHLSVAGNLAFARQRAPQQAAIAGYDDVVRTMKLESLLARDVNALSGGERQRVAIARTLLAQPRLMLLDEPLASLDAGRKGEILPYLETLTKQFSIPAIYVSHSVNEIARLADDLVVLDNGRVAASGAAAGILGGDAAVSSKLPFEAVTVLDMRVVEHLPSLHLTRLEHHGQSMSIPMLNSAQPGDTVRVAVRAGDVVIATQRPEGLSVRNVLSGAIGGIESIQDSAFARVSVVVNGSRLHALLTRHAVAELRLAVGMPVYALVKVASFERAESV